MIGSCGCNKYNRKVAAASALQLHEHVDVAAAAMSSVTLPEQRIVVRTLVVTAAVAAMTAAVNQRVHCVSCGSTSSATTASQQFQLPLLHASSCSY
jgi:hypothetical protein